jgi:hypothetical protein
VDSVGSPTERKARQPALRTAALGTLLGIQALVVVSLVPWWVITVFLMPRPMREDAWFIAHLFLANTWAYPLFLLVLSVVMWALFALRQYRGAIAMAIAAASPTAFFAVLFLLPNQWFR